MIPNEALYKMRKEYSGKPLDKEHARSNPFDLFHSWLDEAINAQVLEPNAMVIATAGKNASPSVRTVLLKQYDKQGFVFFTNYQSHKGTDINENPNGEILFAWLEVERQIRIHGSIEKTSREESEYYFKNRPYNARIGALASSQSNIIDNKQELLNRFDTLAEKYPESSDIPCPDYWGGYRLKPETFEFWQGRPNRLHDRLFFKLLSDDKWNVQYLQP
jgi:pyridoxamine 5'-phosphate oxidase